MAGAKETGSGLSRTWLLDWRQRNFGQGQAHEPLTALLTLVIVTAASYAIAINQIPGSSRIAHGFYLGITIIIVSVVGYIVKSDSGQPPVMTYDKSTFRFGQLIAYTAIVLCFLFIGFGLRGYFPGQTPNRRDYTASEIPTVAPEIATMRVPKVSSVGGFRQGAPEDAKLADRFITWFGATGSMNAEKEQVLIVEQHPAFDSDFNSFSAVMLFREPGVEFKDALVFLRRRLPVAGGGAIEYVPLSWEYGDVKDAVASEYVYEQLQLPRKQSGQAYPVITVPNPDKGDALIIFARFAAPKDSMLEPDAKWFNFKLWRAQR